VAIDLDDLAVRASPDLGEPGAAREHRDFAGEHPRAERHYDLLDGPLAKHIDATRHDDEDPRRLLPRLRQHLSLLHVAPAPARGDAVDLRRRQRRVEAVGTRRGGRPRGWGNERHW